MFKAKKLSATLFFIFSASALGLPAHAAFSPTANFNGFYAGVNAGGLFSEGKLNTKQSMSFIEPNSSPFVNRIFSTSHAASPYKDSLAGDIHVGYGHALGQSPFYLGAEVFGNLTDHNLNLSSADFMGEDAQGPFNVSAMQSIKIKLNNAEYGVDVRPGLLITPSTLFFARVGVAFNEVRVNTNSNVTINNLDTGNVRTTTLPANVNKHIEALRLGGGIEERIGSHWGVSANYIYTDYGNINLSAKTNTINDTGSLQTGGFTTYTSARHLISQAAMFGVNYYFDPAANETGEFLQPDYYISPAAFNGFSATISGGMLQDRAAMNINTAANFSVATSNNETIKDTESPRVARDTGIGAISVGYGHLIGNTSLYLGGDIYASLGNQDLLANYNAHDNIVQFNNVPGDAKKILGTVRVHLNSVEWGGDIRPGILLGPRTLLYGRVGFARNKIELGANKKFEFIDDATPDILYVSSLSEGSSKAVTGLRLGAGLEEYIGQHLSMNFDYIYTDFGNVSINGLGQLTSSIANDSGPVGLGAANVGAVQVVTANGLVNSSQAKISSQAIMVGLSYHFGSPSEPSCPTGYNLIPSK